ncbi:DNA-directed RNA polymerase [Cricetulus griseus]|uniref:DNA-directed RNA polymerase n=1 Tax=Cricetulus griseus TaxID=10029 RepID=A0A061I540_CRIGR|nr:DNA-directed RNA polymerase [Cricetulus griseus]
MSEATVKKVQMDQPPNGHSSRWAQKLEAERQVKGKRQKELLDQHQKHTLTLQMEPWIWSKKLAGCLQQSKKGAPKSLEEEEQLLTQALKAALQKLSSCTLAKSNATAVEANILLLQQKFLAFFECCACTDNVPLAHHVLVTQHSKCDKQQLLTLDMYNTVMLSWARKGSFKELVYVFIMLKDAGLSPNLWSYAAALQCMGRRDQDVHIIQRCLKQMMEEGFQPQQLFTDLVLTGEERDALLRAVVKAEPAFILPPQAPEPVNTSILLQEVYAKQKGPKSYPKLHLPLETLQDLFHQQLHVELSANVCVQSVEKAPVMTKEVIEARKTLKTLQGQWEAELLRVLQQTKATMAHQAQEGQPTLYPFLCLLSEGEFVSMLMQVLRLLPAQGEPLLHLAHDLGLRVLNRHLVKQKQATNHVQKLGQHYSQYLRLLASDTQVEAPCLPREYWESLGPLETPMQQPWSLTVLLHLGKQLAEMLVQAVQMPRNLSTPQASRHLIPVLYHVYSFRSYRQIHLVNLTGLRKRDSLRMRLRFADEVMEEILDSADNPMTGRKWWMEADEPWQTLACCIEVARAVRSPDAAAYVSHLPVHQVEELRQRDAKDGLQVAHVLKGFITRKVVKQTVMTVVYGVTRYGGRLQIEKRLRELSNFPQEFVWEASHYLVRLVFKSLQEMFSSTRAIQHWLTESANLISHSGWPVEWVTPLGIPVIQPYHREAKVQVKGGIQSITMTSSMDITQKPNTLKQKNGFPPNFIHSLDSAHMMLTALHCYRKGLTFVSVHDCFWTHAADIPVMNEVCREQFVRLHSQPILEDLAKFLEKRFCSVSSSQKPSELALATKLQKTLQSLPKTGKGF